MSVNIHHEIVQLENANSLKLKKENKRTKTLKLVQIGKLCVFVVFIFVFFFHSCVLRRKFAQDGRSFSHMSHADLPHPLHDYYLYFFRYYTTFLLRNHCPGLFTNH